MVFLLIIIASGAALWFLQPYLSFEAVKSYRSQIQQLYAARPFYWAVIYFLVYVVLTALSVPIASALSLVAGLLMGAHVGAMVVSVAATVGSLFAMWIVRYLTRELIARKFQEPARRVNDGLRRDGRFYLFALRLNPVLPFFVVNLAMGLTEVSAFDFAWVSWIGMLPGSWLYTNAGERLGQINSAREVLTVPVAFSLAALGVVPLLIKRILQRFAKRTSSTQ